MKKLYSLFCALFIMMQLSISAQNVTVTATAGTVSATYANLKSAFDNINNGTHQGIIDIRIHSNTTESATCLLDSSGNATNSSYASILIRPADTATVSKTVSMSVTNATLITLQGADTITFDGRPMGAGSNSLLTFSNMVDGAASHTIELINGASLNSFNYCHFENAINGAGNSNNFRILTGLNSGNTISNSIVTGGLWGIEINGSNANPNDNISILSSQMVNQKGTGIRLFAGIGNTAIDSNRIYHTVASTNAGYQGILISFINTASTVFCTRNRIYDLNLTGNPNTIQGIAFNATIAANGTLNILNNYIIIGSASFPNTLTRIIRGIYYSGTFPATVRVASNTVRIGGTHTIDNTGSPNTVGIIKVNSSSTSDFTSGNNISINTRTGGAFTHVANYISTPSTGTNLIDYNTYYGPVQSAIWVGTQYNNITTYKAATGTNEQNSSFGILDFVNDLNPDLLFPSANNTVDKLMGFPSAVTVDIYGTTRSITEPYRGAFEGAPLSTLPVNLISFIADVKKEDVLLTWKTNSEINNRGFDIERSVDGRVFNKVGYIAGSTAGSVTNTYSYNDVAAFSRASSAILFYRLKQLDISGRFTFSPVKVVNVNNARLGTVSAYPNPFVKTLQVTIESRSAGNAIIQIIDASGKVMSNTIRPVTTGINNISVKETSNLGNGVYYMKVITGDVNKVIKLVKTY